MVPFRERVTCTVTEACDLTGLGRTYLYARIAEGKLESLTVGKRRLIRVASLLALVGEKVAA